MEGQWQPGQPVEVSAVRIDASGKQEERSREFGFIVS